jgi:WD40 repeat protein
LSGHNDTVCDIIFTTDQERIISCSYDSKIKLWDKQSGKLLLTMNENVENRRGHADRISYLAAHPQYVNYVASCGADKRVLLWDLSTGDMIQDITGNDSKQEYVELQFDGLDLFAMTNTENYDGAIDVWNVSAERVVKNFSILGGFESMGLSKSGLLAAGGSAGSILVCDTRMIGRPTSTIHNRHNKSVQSVSFSPCGTYLQSCGADSRAYVYDVRLLSKERCLLEIKHDELSFGAEAEERPMWGSWTNTEGTNILATGGEDGVVCIWDVISGEQLNRLEVSKNDRIAVLHFAPDDTALCVATDQVLHPAKINIYYIDKSS